jgi:hypothetical protein
MRAGRPKKLRRRGVLAWLRDVAGNATTETVIMIPVFVAIWGGIWYTHGRYRKAQNMAQFTRAHVWAHAWSGCEGGASGSTDIGERGTDSSGFIDGAVSLLFASGIIPGFQFDEVEGRRRTSIERPAVLGEGTVQMGHDLVVMCNERTQDDVGGFDAAWGMFF